MLLIMCRYVIYYGRKHLTRHIHFTIDGIKRIVGVRMCLWREELEGVKWIRLELHGLLMLVLARP